VQATASQAPRSVARTFVVAALGIFVIITTLPGLSLVWDSTDTAWTSQGELGMQTDYDGRVKAVAEDSVASQAGILPGDRIDLFRTPFESRAYVAGSPARAPAGVRVDLWVIHNGVDRLVTLIPPHQPLPVITRVNLVDRTIAALIFVIVGGLLVLLRPSPVTWGFYFYCLGFSPGIAFASFSRYPSPPMHAVNVIGTDVLTAAGTVGILLFALGFLCDDPAPWRRLLARAAPVLFVLFAVLVAYPDVANLLLGWPAELAQRIMLALQGLVFALALFAVVQTYIHGEPQNRPRIQWVVVGLFIGVIANYIADVLSFSSALPLTPPRWFESSLLVFNVTLPLTVAYAVVRHRVFEVSFVVSRAIVYATLTFFIASAFSLIEYLVGHELAAVRLAQIIEIVLAIGVSFWIKALETRVEKVVDIVFFRKRREAMRRLERDANALHRSNAAETVDDYVVGEAAEALALSSAALFRRHGAKFERTASSGWPNTTLQAIGEDDRLVLMLQAEAEPLRCNEIGWQNPELPTGNAAPILAVPLMNRQDLAAFVFYGPHESGADIDPEEQAHLFDLCRAAQSTYEELRLGQLTKQVEELSAEVTRLRNGSVSAAAASVEPPPTGPA
jgi:hypothetical protein